MYSELYKTHLNLYFILYKIVVFLNSQPYKKKKKGDFKVDGKYTFEVGGPSKDFTQIAGVPDSYILADDIDYPYGNKLPLWIVGFLY